jgi:hypothetical protein
MSEDWCHAVTAGVRLAVQVMPNAKKNEVVGPFDGMLKIRLQAQPIEGKANEALIRYLARMLAISKSAVSITHGHTGKRKIVEIKTALDAAAVRRALLAATGA